MSDLQGLPPNYFYHKLPNGIELIGQYMPSLSSISFGFQLDAAVVNEPEEKQGLSHLFEYMLFQGTKKKDARALNEAFESLGARKGASTSLETAMTWAQIVNTKFDATLDLFHEILLQPTFPKDELEPMRNLVLQEIRRRDDEPMSRIFELVRGEFYKGTPLSRPVLGTNESVQNIQRADLQNFWQQYYHPNDTIFALAGKFDWEHVVERLDSLFSDWKGQSEKASDINPEPANRVTLEYSEGKQEHLCMMAPFPNYTDPDYYAAMVATEVLGGNMASRLFVEVREKRGLVYGIQAGLAGNKHIGSLRIYAGTTPEQAHECLEVTLNELRKLEHEGITNDELERAKLQLKSENVMRSEGSGARMNSILRSWWYERKLRTVQETKDAIDAVTQEQVLNVMQRYSPLNPLTVAAIGPLSREELVGDLLP